MEYACIFLILVYSVSIVKTAELQLVAHYTYSQTFHSQFDVHVYHCKKKKMTRCLYQELRESLMVNINNNVDCRFA